MTVMVTGAAGFIGMHVCMLLLQRGDEVVGVDNLNDYYDPALKSARLGCLKEYPNFVFAEVDISDSANLRRLFDEYLPEKVINLAAQAGVRYSIENPGVYVQSNLVGFGNILECCRHAKVSHLVYASSSSVYGSNANMPFSVHHNVDHPVSLYAATKKANELMAHTYSHLYDLPTTGLRYFTVYGPWGRPDMSPWLFTSAILDGRPIKVFNNGNMFRDFTYIDDIAKGTVSVLDRTPLSNPLFDNCNPDPGTSTAPYRVYNIGNNQPVALMDFISTLEKTLGREAEKVFLPMQDGDVIATCADVEDLIRDVDFSPETLLESGLAKWVDWYRAYSNNQN